MCLILDYLESAKKSGVTQLEHETADTSGGTPPRVRCLRLWSASVRPFIVNGKDRHHTHDPICILQIVNRATAQTVFLLRRLTLSLYAKMRASWEDEVRG
jgi:hypothetical protein